MATVFTLLFLLLVLSGPISAWIDHSGDMNDRDRRTTWPGAKV
jgi:hypothetical protein